MNSGVGQSLERWPSTPASSRFLRLGGHHGHRSHRSGSAIQRCQWLYIDTCLRRRRSNDLSRESLGRWLKNGVFASCLAAGWVMSIKLSAAWQHERLRDGDGHQCRGRRHLGDLARFTSFLFSAAENSAHRIIGRQTTDSGLVLDGKVTRTSKMARVQARDGTRQPCKPRR